jgi:RNA recognition motif-containing protein
MKIFVAKLSPTVTESQLFELFASRVDVWAVNIIRDDNRESRGYGFVELRHGEELNQALALDGLLFHGRFIAIQAAKTKNESNGGSLWVITLSPHSPA